MFDTLKYAKKLQDVGVPREQAEAQVIILAEVMEDSLATKSDVKDLRGETRGIGAELRSEMADLKSELRAEMVELRTELRTEMAELRTELRNDMVKLRSEFCTEMAELRTEMRTEMTSLKHELGQFEHRMTIKIGTIITVALGAFVALNKIL